MFPLRDSIPADRLPWVNWLLLCSCLAVFGWAWTLDDPESQQRFAEQWGLVPSRVRFGFAHPELLLDTPWQWLREVLFPFVSSMFIHGGVMHLVGNLWFLLVFGDNVEGRLGHLGYLGFYVACGAVAALLHIAMLSPEMVEAAGGSVATGGPSPLDVPMVGASGAIAGVLGAYVVAFPRARVLTFLPPIFLFEMPALLFLGFWFALQFFSARQQLLVGSLGVGVAYWAHVGGFLAGALLAVLLGLRRPKARA